MALIKTVGGHDPEAPPVVLTKEQLEEERQVLENKKKAMDELLKQECIGKYKIEIFFSYRRSITKPTPGALSIWESGSKLHGGGDAKVYFCPGEVRGINDCASIIPFDNVNYGHGLCPRCGKVWKSDEMVGEILGNWPMQTWAKKVTDYFTALGHSADIYVKQPRGDIRKAAELEQEKQLGGEKLDVVRKGVVKYIYPLARILKDTQSGADIYDRFYAFLKS
jgi:hypothetical protein